MESTATHIELMYKKAKTYTETSIELYKLNAIDTTADVVSSLVARLALGSTLAVFLLFINIGISLYIGQLLQASYLGFLIVSLVYLALGIVIFIFNKQLIQIPITNLVIAKLLKKRVKEASLSNSLKEVRYDE